MSGTSRMAMQQNGNVTEQPNRYAQPDYHCCCRRPTWFEEMRGWIMVVAILVASVTYASGLNPPGGFWQEDLNGHEAGGPILHDKHQTRYTSFFYANATAFMTSLVIIILLMNDKFYSNMVKVVILNIFLVVGLVSLMIAYAAGSTRRFSTSLYVIALAVGVMAFVLYSANVMAVVHAAVRRHNSMHGIEIEAQNGTRSQN